MIDLLGHLMLVAGGGLILAFPHVLGVERVGLYWLGLGVGILLGASWDRTKMRIEE